MIGWFLLLPHLARKHETRCYNVTRCACLRERPMTSDDVTTNVDTRRDIDIHRGNYDVARIHVTLYASEFDSKRYNITHDVAFMIAVGDSNSCRTKQDNINVCDNWPIDSLRFELKAARTLDLCPASRSRSTVNNFPEGRKDRQY